MVQLRKVLLFIKAALVVANLIEFQKFNGRKKHIPFIQLVQENSTVRKIDDDQNIDSEQTSEKCSKESYFINSPEDIYYLQQKCPLLEGTLTFSGEYNERVIDLGNIREVKGDIIIESNPNVFKIEGEKLEKIGNKLQLKNLMSLVTIDLPVLAKIKTINWKVVPVLNNVNLGNKFEGLKSITISDSSIYDLDAFKNVQELSIFNINNNRYLETIDSDLVSVKKQLSIHANADELVVKLNSLTSADNITVRDAADISLPNLTLVNSSMEFIENYFTELKLPKLKKIDGTLGIIGNPNLNNVNFEGLKTLHGGLMIANNSKLDNIDFFPNLKQIGGAIYFDGDFNSTNMPNLKLVKGSAYIKSSSDQFSCKKWFIPVNGKAIIRGGNIKCISKNKESSLNVNEEGSIEEESQYEEENDEYDDDKKPIKLRNRAEVLTSKMFLTIINSVVISLFLFFVI